MVKAQIAVSIVSKKMCIRDRALDVDLSDNTAALKNKTTQQLNVLYHLYWYNTQGVTQVWPNQQESQSGNILLQPQEKKVFELPKPSTESTNYRLYLQ